MRDGLPRPYITPRDERPYAEEERSVSGWKEEPYEDKVRPIIKKEITIEQLIDKYGTNWNTAGSNVVIDGPSLKIIRRAKLTTFVLNGKRLNQIERAINNESFDGTTIKI